MPRSPARAPFYGVLTLTTFPAYLLCVVLLFVGGCQPKRGEVGWDGVDVRVFMFRPLRYARHGPCQEIH